MNDFSKKLLDELNEIGCLEVVNHKNDSGFVNVRCTTSKDLRRINVVGDLNTKTGNMRLYSNGKWVSINKLRLINIEEIITFVKNDIKLLTK
ncbi:hypothetical protein [Neobacillus niacini]|uniref:hypothetical protein n=1 Tax=Neobacillus niacini TaxID=86668 RepID=UPI003983402D